MPIPPPSRRPTRRNEEDATAERMTRRGLASLLGLATLFGRKRAQAAEASWVDPRTGHRIVRLSDTPDLYSLYFHQNGFTRAGDAVVLYDHHDVWLLDIASGRQRSLYHWDEPAARPASLVVSRRSDTLYLLAAGAIWRFALPRGERQRIATLPPEWSAISSLTVNADETLLAGNYTEGVRQIEAATPRRGWIAAAEQRHLASLIFTVRITTGATEVIHRDVQWLDHPQFSPSDPALLSFNRQIPPISAEDNTLLMRADGSAPRPVLRRTEHGEALIHNFFSPSGREVWYDLQSPWGRRFFIGTSAIDGSRDLRYPIDTAHWCYHYNLSPDESLIAGDGNPQFPDGKWLYLFRRQADHVVPERLVDLSRHDYALEPNVQFSPNGKWVLFRANFESAPHAYMVEVQRSAGN
jgi:oligogalacturonide lyase